MKNDSERSLSALMRNLPSMAYRRRNDELLTMEFVSEGCLDLTGYEPSELLENSVAAYAQLVHPGDLEERADLGVPELLFFKLRLVPDIRTRRLICTDRLFTE